MKRITLLTVMMLATVLSFAQKGRPMQQIHHLPAQATWLVKQAKGLDRQTTQAYSRAKAAKAEAQLVTPPAGAEEQAYTAEGEYYYYSSTNDNWYIMDDASPAQKSVVINGSDIYIQGLAYWMPDAWIKGTISGATAVFPSGQFVGEDEYGAEYLNGENTTLLEISDIVFLYDAATGTLTLDAETAILESPEADSKSAYGLWETLTLTPGELIPDEPVEAPADLQTAEWLFKAQNLTFDDDENPVYTDVTMPVNVGFADNEVYIQGLCEYLPEAWVKGTRSGSTVTIESGQFFGDYETMFGSYPMYFVGYGLTDIADIQMTINSDENTLTTDNWVLINATKNTISPRIIFTNVAITLVAEKAATPATPQITGASLSGSYPSIEANIPLTDINGEALLASKLSYQLVYDIEGDIHNYVLKAADYESLDEDMETVPYLFDDDWDIYRGASGIYLYGNDLALWNRVGIKSIYTGGGETHESEIGWFDIKPYSDPTDVKATFDFNALPEDTPTSNSGHDGDITQNLVIEEGGVTLTVTPSDANTPNRYWKEYNSGLIQLRVYGGTMTFEAGDGQTIKQIVFDNGKWNEDNTADSGTLTDGVWSGDAQKVVVTIAGNTQINKITLTLSSTSAINAIATDAKQHDATIYTIQGLPVKDASQKGIYIQNGKKFVVK